MSFLLLLLNDMALAAVPAVGFALLFNVPRESLIYCAVGGALGHGLRFALLKAGMPVEWATWLAASAVSFVGVYWAQRLAAHPKVFSVAAIIPMIPGKYAFTAMLTLFQMNEQGMSSPLLATFINAFLKMVFITGGLAAGLAMPGLLFYRRKPVV